MTLQEALDIIDSEDPDRNQILLAARFLKSCYLLAEKHCLNFQEILTLKTQAQFDQNAVIRRLDRILDRLERIEQAYQVTDHHEPGMP